MVIEALTWGIEWRVEEACRGVQVPKECPANWLFMPAALRPEVLQWSHSSKYFGLHPSAVLVALIADVRQFVLAYSICAQSKPSHRPPAGLLYPLSIPSHPWSHIALDFVTGLPPSGGNTVILTVWWWIISPKRSISFPSQNSPPSKRMLYC